VLNELDRVTRLQDPNADTAMRLEMTGLQESLKERDRTIADLKKQMKYYVAFAENSITGHPDEPTDEEVKLQTTERLALLEEELDGAKVTKAAGITHF
jgi:hypothetical protein